MEVAPGDIGRGGLGGLNDLRGLFQPKWFHNSTILWRGAHPCWCPLTAVVSPRAPNPTLPAEPNAPIPAFPDPGVEISHPEAANTNILSALAKLSF